MGVLIRVVAWLSFVVATALTVLHWVQPDLWVVQRAVLFTPWSIPLFTIALLLFLFHVFFPGKSRWQITMVLAGLSMVGLGLQGWWISPLFAGSNPEPGSGTEGIRVLTLNLDDGAADPNDVVSTAVTSRADFLILQEVSASALGRMDEAGLEAAFPHRAGQPVAGGHFGTMIFSTAQLSQPTFAGTLESSVLVTASLPGGTVWVFGVDVPVPDSSKAWSADLEKLAELASSLKPGIVAGTFNASFDHQAFQDLLDTGLRDVGERTNAGFQRTWPEGLTRYGVPLPRLALPDHVLAGAGLVAVKQSTTSVPGTDHRGVLVEVAFR